MKKKDEGEGKYKRADKLQGSGEEGDEPGAGKGPRIGGPGMGRVTMTNGLTPGTKSLRLCS